MTVTVSPTSRAAERSPADADDPTWSIVPASERLHGWRRQVALPGASTGSAHDPLRVAEGALDAVVVLYGGPWDHAPFVVLVEEAGGRFSDLWGGRRLDTRTAIYSNGLAHDDLRVRAATLAPDAPESHDDQW